MEIRNLRLLDSPGRLICNRGDFEAGRREPIAQLAIQHIPQRIAVYVCHSLEGLAFVHSSIMFESTAMDLVRGPEAALRYDAIRQRGERGALLLVISMAIHPFVQQLLIPIDCNTTVADEKATILRTNYFDVPDDASSIVVNPGLE
ncbi:hypothetical protein SCUP234_09665 [Seiridium cupressi]